jgi:MarR family transcriptional regulator, organic hydroperoxide resistance regulator
VHESSADDPLALERQVCFALATANRSVLKVYRPVLEPMGLTHPQYLVMLALWERSPRSLRDIAETLLLEPPTLTPLLKRLEAIGYVARGRNPDDERELRARAESVPTTVAGRLGVSADVLQRARAVLDELRAAAEAVGHDD